MIGFVTSINTIFTGFVTPINAILTGLATSIYIIYQYSENVNTFLIIFIILFLTKLIEVLVLSVVYLTIIFSKYFLAWLQKSSLFLVSSAVSFCPQNSTFSNVMFPIEPPSAEKCIRNA